MTKNLPVLITLLALVSIGCDEAKRADAEAAELQANASIAASDFELAAVVALVEREDVRDAESLEVLINAEDSPIRVDVDADGTRDFVQVRELGDRELAGDAAAVVKTDADGAMQIAAASGHAVHFEFRAVPSSKIELQSATVETDIGTVVVASMDIELHAVGSEVVVEARYAPTLVVVSESHVDHVYVHRIAVEHRDDHFVVVGAPFIAWVWIDSRPLYLGHYHLPPGQAKKLGLHWDGHPGRGPGGHSGHAGPGKFNAGHSGGSDHGGVGGKGHGGVGGKGHGGGSDHGGVGGKGHGGGASHGGGGGKGHGGKGKGGKH